MIVFGYPTPDGPIFFGSIDGLLEMIEEGLKCETAFDELVPAQGTEYELKIILRHMTKEELEALPEY